MKISFKTSENLFTDSTAALCFSLGDLIPAGNTTKRLIHLKCCTKFHVSLNWFLWIEMVREKPKTGVQNGSNTYSIVQAISCTMCCIVYSPEANSSALKKKVQSTPITAQHRLCYHTIGRGDNGIEDVFQFFDLGSRKFCQHVSGSYPERAFSQEDTPYPRNHLGYRIRKNDERVSFGCVVYINILYSY